MEKNQLTKIKKAYILMSYHKLNIRKSNIRNWF